VNIVDAQSSGFYVNLISETIEFCFEGDRIAAHEGIICELWFDAAKLFEGYLHFMIDSYADKLGNLAIEMRQKKKDGILEKAEGKG